MWQKGLLSLVTEKAVFESQGSALTFVSERFLEDGSLGIIRCVV